MKSSDTDVPIHWTPREREVLDLLVAGRTNPEIAEALQVSLSGAKWHVSEIISKLGVDSRDEAADYWRGERGWPRRLWRQVRVVLFSTPTRWLAVGACTGALAGSVFVGVVLTQQGDTQDITPSGTQVGAFDPLALARIALQREAPGVAAIVDAVERGDESAVVPMLGMQHVQCATPVGAKGDNRLACARWGVPESSYVDAFEADVAGGWFLTPDEAKATVAAILEGSPQLAFVASKPGTYFVYFRTRPLTLDLGLGAQMDTNYDGVAVTIADSGEKPIQAIEPHWGPSPSSIVEQADDWGQRGNADYHILGLSSAIVADSQAIRPQSFGQFQFSASGVGDATEQAAFFSAATFPRALAELTASAPAEFTVVCGADRTVVADSNGPISAESGVVIVNTPGDGTQCSWDVQTAGSWSIRAG